MLTTDAISFRSKIFQKKIVCMWTPRTLLEFLWEKKLNVKAYTV